MIIQGWGDNPGVFLRLPFIPAERGVGSMSAKVAILVIALVAGLLAVTLVTAAVLMTDEEAEDADGFAANDQLVEESATVAGDPAEAETLAETADPPQRDHAKRIAAMRLARDIMPTLLEAYANGSWDGNLSELPDLLWDANDPWYELPERANRTRDGNCTLGDGGMRDGMPHRGPQFRNGFAHGFTRGYAEAGGFADGFERPGGFERPDRIDLPPLGFDDPGLEEVGGLD